MKQEFLDADVVIELIRGNYQLPVRSKIYVVSSITGYEVMRGVSHPLTKRGHRTIAFLDSVDIISFDKLAYEFAAKIYQSLNQKGTKVGEADMMLGGHALSLSSSVLTFNVQHFRRFEGLDVRDAGGL